MQAAFSDTAGKRAAYAAGNDNAAAGWFRGNLEEWRATLPPERLEADNKTLSRIFSLAAKVPELGEALDWAHDHGIEFIVDRKASAGGYYTVGTGVVALVERYSMSDAIAVGVIVHEIRHAWQDYYGMIPTTGKSFPGYFMRLGVVEADATAHQTLAVDQYHLSQTIGAYRKQTGGTAAERAERLQRQLDDKNADQAILRKAFQNWYRGKVTYYWLHCRDFLGSRLGIPGVHARTLGAEYNPYAGRPDPLFEGIDIMRDEQLRRLGKGFKGKNYFNAAMRDFFAHEALAPSRAEADYKTGPSGQKYFQKDKTISEIRRRQLLLKRHRGHEVLL